MGFPAIFNGNAIQLLKDVLQTKSGAQVIFGSADPSSSATSGSAGDVYVSSGTNSIYIKQDSGSSTNWSILASATAAVSDTAYNASSWDGVTATAPSKNAVRDEVETLITSIAAKLPLAGGTMAGDIAMGTHSITGAADPVNPQDVSTKNYVDTVAAGLNPQQGVTAASTANIPNTYLNGVAGVGATLTPSATGALSLDGTSPALNSRVLIKNQTNGFENGIYNVTLVGSGGISPILTRALDYNTANDIDAGDLIAVENGTVNALTTWVQTANVTTVGSDSLSFTKFSINPSNVLTTALTSAHLLVGNVSNIATDVAVTGDVTISNTGVTAIGAGTVTNAMHANMADKTVKGNISGGSAAPSDVSLVTTATASTVTLRDANANIIANNFIEGYRTTATSAGTLTLVVGDAFLQYLTGSTTHTVKMPVTSTLVAGQQYTVVNLSSGVVTVQSSGANTIQAMAANTQLILTVINTGVTTAAGWNSVYSTISGNVLASQLPNPTSSTLGGVQSAAAVSNQWINSISTSGVPALSQPAFSNISGSVAASQLPNPTSSTLGGIESYAAVSNQWINAISTSGVPSSTQPAFSNISGTAATTQGGTGVTTFLAPKAWLNFTGVPLAGTYSQSGTTNTVTMTAHGMQVGDMFYISFSSGTGVAGSYTVATQSANSFTYTAGTSLTTSGNCSRGMWLYNNSGISSVVRNGTGDYSITFTNAFSSIHYYSSCNAARPNGTGSSGTWYFCNQKLAVAKTTTTFRASVANEAGGGADADEICCIFSE